VTNDPRIIEGPYLEDLLAQPSALKDTHARLERPPSLMRVAARLGEFRQIVLTGMGSSFHALHLLNLELTDHGIPSTMLETSELVHHYPRALNPETLVIAVSQSGESAEMLRLAQVQQNATVIAVTNTPDSTLARHAACALFTHAGPEFSVSCKTYVTALMTLKWLADALCGCDAEESRRKLQDAGPAMADYLAGWKSHIWNLTDLLGGIRDLFLAGRGRSLAAVGTGALVIKEADHFHAEGMSSAAFRHGPFEMLSQEVFVAVFAGDEKTRQLNDALVADVRKAGARAEVIGERSAFESFRLGEYDPAIRPILEILPVQMITIALAALAGREAGKFERATKITRTE
jgi:glutamine---fructose-6-phosphate transaminase (isomerizing)